MARVEDENRRRTVRKLVSFTPLEWERVSGRMEMSAATRFDAWAREVLLGAPVRVVNMPFVPQQVRVELARLGNNVNQIARQVNIDEAATLEELRLVKQVMQEVQKVIDQAARRGRRG